MQEANYGEQTSLFHSTNHVEFNTMTPLPKKVDTTKASGSGKKARLEELMINPVLRDTTPPLTELEFNLLEKNIISDGCIREPIVVWNNFILDGHARHKIAMRHGIRKYTIVEMKFDSEDDARLWVIDRHLGRRNLSQFARIELALLRKPLIEAKAKANMAAGGGDKKTGSQQVASPIEKVHTRDEIAKLAGVSHETVRKAEKILEGAALEDIRALREGRKKIGAVFSAMKGAGKNIVTDLSPRECTIESFEAAVNNIVAGVNNTIKVEFAPLFKSKKNNEAAKTAIDKAVAALVSLKDMIA